MNYKEGDEVRHNATGTKGYIFELNPDPDYDPEDETWATLYSMPDEYLGDRLLELDRPEDVTLLRSYKDVPTPKRPTDSEIVSFVQMALLEEYDGISVNETDINGEPKGQILAYGRTENGVRFGFRVTISEIEELMW